MLVLILILSVQAAIAYTEGDVIEEDKYVENTTLCSPDVVLIDYSYNSLLALANDTFSGCLALEVVKVDHNDINEIESGAFWNLNELEYVDLSDNRINHLDGRLFENNQKLRTVILSHNPLAVPQLTSPSLLNLVCNFCKRTQVTETTFAEIPNVQSISLVGTKVLPFDVEDLPDLLLSLQEFRLNEKHWKRCFVKREYPTLVLLQQNNVTLGPDVFCKENDCIRTMNLLICKHMYLETIDPPKSNVIMADYSYNSLSKVSNESFVSQHSIRIIRLNHNVIKHIDVDAFRTLANLQYVDLSHNKLETIDESLFADNQNLLTVDLSHNSIIVPLLRSDSLETLVCDFCKRIQVEENSFLKTPNLKSLRLLGTEVVPFEVSAAKTLPDLWEFEVTRNDSRRCFLEEDYPGLVYLQKRKVILGDDVFCKPLAFPSYSYSLPDDIVTRIHPLTRNHGQSNSLATFPCLILSYTVVTLFK